MSLISAQQIADGLNQKLRAPKHAVFPVIAIAAVIAVLTNSQVQLFPPTPTLLLPRHLIIIQYYYKREPVTQEFKDNKRKIKYGCKLK